MADITAHSVSVPNHGILHGLGEAMKAAHHQWRITRALNAREGEVGRAVHLKDGTVYKVPRDYRVVEGVLFFDHLDLNGRGISFTRIASVTSKGDH